LALFLGKALPLVRRPGRGSGALMDEQHVLHRFLLVGLVACRRTGSDEIDVSFPPARPAGGERAPPPSRPRRPPRPRAWSTRDARPRRRTGRARWSPAPAGRGP